MGISVGEKDDYIWLLKVRCNAAMRRVRAFENGHAYQLLLDYANRAEREKKVAIRKAILKGIMTSPVVNTDFTNANVNGESKQVLIAASSTTDTALYISRDAKGHKGIIGTPIEKYVGILVHDHDVTFYNYGLMHQECIQHILRYLVGSMQNEQQLKENALQRLL